MFGRSRSESPQLEKDIGLLGVDTKFEGAVRFTGTLRIDGVVEGNISSEPGSGSVLIVNQQASVAGNIVSDSVLISGRVEGDVHARERVEIYRSGLLKGDVYTADIMIEGGAEFHGYCHMANGNAAGHIVPPPPPSPPPRARGPRPGEGDLGAEQADSEDAARA